MPAYLQTRPYMLFSYLTHPAAICTQGSSKPLFTQIHKLTWYEEAPNGQGQKPSPSSYGCGSAVIRLDSPNRDDTVAPLLHRFCHQKFQFPDLYPRFISCLNEGTAPTPWLVPPFHPSASYFSPTRIEAALLLTAVVDREAGQAVTLLPLSWQPVRSSRLIHTSIPSGRRGSCHRWIGVGKIPILKRPLGTWIVATLLEI
jgi:hypothetical protein